jgi:hypothetical protein
VPLELLAEETTAVLVVAADAAVVEAALLAAVVAVTAEAAGAVVDVPIAGLLVLALEVTGTELLAAGAQAARRITRMIRMKDDFNFNIITYLLLYFTRLYKVEIY